MATLFAYMAAVFLLFAAASGAAILRGFLRRRKVAVGGALVHGLFAISGLILLALALAWQQPGTGPGWWGQIAMIILVIVAIGGGTLVYFHIWHRKVPLWLAFGHATGAVVGVILLWFALLQRLFMGP